MCYILVEEPMQYYDAQRNCKTKLNGQLATIPDRFVNAFVNGRVQQGSQLYFGLSDLKFDGQFLWMDDSALEEYAPWTVGQPSGVDADDRVEDCVRMEMDGTWNDVKCATTHQSVCEQPANEGGKYY